MTLYFIILLFYKNWILNTLHAGKFIMTFSSSEPMALGWANSIPVTPASVHQTFQTSSPLQPLGKLNSNFILKVSKGAKIRNRYNQVPHLTQDTNGKVTNSQLDTIKENQETRHRGYPGTGIMEGCGNKSLFKWSWSHDQDGHHPIW